MIRTMLPNRRYHEVINIADSGQNYHVGIGRAANGRVLEIWINGGKSGTHAETFARDWAVTASIALQHGTPVDAMRKSIARDRSGRATGLAGKILDWLAREER